MTLASRRDLEEELASLCRYRSVPSSEAFRRLLRNRSLAPWLQDLDVIKITGSNGKGSVATWTAAILRAAGIRTGLYTSPHLNDFCERIVVDGEPISEARLTAAADRFRQAHQDLQGAGLEVISFEAVTAIALEAFAEAEVEVVVAEAGIGGRHDATRLLPGSTHGLVSVDHEHRDLLGDSLQEIARHKADIAASGSALMLGDLPPSIRDDVVRHGGQRGVDVLPFAPGIDLGEVSFEGASMLFDITGDGTPFPRLHTSAVGVQQAVKCGLAIRLANHWLARNKPGEIAEEAWRRIVHRAASQVRLLGRAERLLEEPPVIVDTAHTPSALAYLARLLPHTSNGRNWVLVAGVSADKTPEDLLSPLLPPHCLATVRVIACQARQRGGEAQRVARLVARQAKELPCETIPQLDLALSRAIDLARQEDLAVVVAGGLFLAAEARQILLPGDGDRGVF